ncbi:MAG: exo-alpha-sialidase, partial [Firmicutes bacterium]|nr:exo-alpha-sialidase [Bacillota bacterium]
AQNLYLGYAPQLRSSMKSNLGTLEGLVIDADDTSATPRRTDANGSMTIPNVSMGNTYSFRAFAPSGYYAKWADMTGDTNDDGYSFGTGDEPKTPRNWDTTGRLNNARTLIGDRIHINLERDNTRYHYYFAKSVLDTPIKVKGKLQRRKASILQLSTTRRESEIKDLSPVSGVFVNIAGSAAMTKEDGSYVVELSANEPWGAVSAAYTVDGIEYVSEANIQHPNDFVVPALPVFEVALNSVKANYENSKYGIANGSSIITTYDSPLTIEMTIQGTSTVKPKDAKFSIYDMDGNYLRDADSSLFTVSKQEFNTTNSTKFTVRFNPKAAVNNGEELYVRFTDSNGKQYSALSTGYKFASELTLDKIVFPAIGSSTLENAANSDITEDIIGNPLGNFLIGQLPGVDLDKATNDYLSPGAEKWMNANPGAPLDSQYQWTATTFNWGFKKSFGGDWKYDSKKKDKDKDKDKGNDGEDKDKGKEGEDKTEKEETKEYDGFEIIEKAEEDGEKVSNDKGSGYSTKSSFNWSLTPFVSFRLSLTQRPVKENGKTSFKPYFEDLTFVVGLNFDVSTNNTISTPIGIDVIINARLNGTVSAVYHMYSDYDDDWEIEGATPYTSSDFGIFKKFGPDSAVRREAYIFLDPVVSVEIGISIKIAELKGKAKFTFDMDFQFTDEEDEVGDMVINYYGDMKIDLGWSVEVFGITVYEKTYDNVKTVELFKQGTNKHINFDTADDMIKALSVEEMSIGGDEPIGNEPVSRAYLKNRGGWNTGSEIQLFSADTTTEKVLQQGSAGGNNVKMIKINDKEMLMLFIDDVPARNNINKRALYYSIGDGTTWSQPQVVNDDGTMDDYPTVTDLGDGRIFVAWSSANKAFESGATVEDALKSLEIQAAFFDKSSKTFGDVETLTKTTKEDYTADIYPHAVYDPTTNKLILYYTKTEYDRIETVGALSDAASVNAYLFYENGKWSNDGSA